MIGSTNASGGGGVFSDEATAGNKDVLEGKTYLGNDTDDELGVGKIPIRKSVDQSLEINGEITLPTGYYDKDNHITQNIPTKEASIITPSTTDQKLNAGQYLKGDQTIASLGGNAPASMVHPAYSFSSNVAGREQAGTMPNRGGYWGFGNNRGVDGGNQRMWVQVPGGYYDENAQVFFSWADIRNLTGLTPDKIKKGQSIMGIIGSFEGYVTNPLYLYNNGAFGGGQTGVSHGTDVTMESNRIKCCGADDMVKFNDLVSTAGYKFLNVVGHHANIEWDSGTVFLENLSGKNLLQATICNNAYTPVTTKVAISNISEPCRLGFYGNSWKDNNGNRHQSLIWVYQVYLSVT